jgi:hypothetical protein
MAYTALFGLLGCSENRTDIINHQIEQNFISGIPHCCLKSGITIIMTIAYVDASIQSYGAHPAFASKAINCVSYISRFDISIPAGLPAETPC